DQALGDYSAAELMEHRAVALRRQLYPEGHRDLAKALNDLAVTVMLRGRLPEAESLAREALEMGKKFPSPYPADVPAWLNNLATLGLTSLTEFLKRQGRLPEAEATGREAVAMQVRLLDGGHPNVALAIFNLALVLEREGNLAEAEAMQRQALAIRRKALGSEH